MLFQDNKEGHYSLCCKKKMDTALEEKEVRVQKAILIYQQKSERESTASQRTILT